MSLIAETGLTSIAIGNIALLCLIVVLGSCSHSHKHTHTHIHKHTYTDDINDPAYWKDALPKILDALRGVPFDKRNKGLLVGHSVTEWEVLAAFGKSI
jgi:hypothetical protein